MKPSPEGPDHPLGNFRRRFVWLALIMIGASLTVLVVTEVLLYRHAIREHLEMLRVTAESQARMIEAVAQFDQATAIAEGHPDPTAAGMESTLEQLVAAHTSYEGFGETGEFTLARLEGDSIHFVLRHRLGTTVLPEPIALVSDLAEPQRRALAGQSGTVIGLDYRGETVLAAHEPVAFVDMGIVAKIDLAEVRAPFVRAGLWAAMVALVVVLSGTGFFFWIANPILRTLEARSRELELEVEQRKRAQAQVANQRDQLRTQVETRTAELAELTEEQRLILDTLEATVWYKDTENRFMRVNRAAAESVGLPVHAIEGRSAEDLFPEHAAQYHRDDLEVIESGKPKLGIVEPLQTRSGDVLWVQTDKVPIFNDDGEVTGVIAHAVDITERVQAEEDLQSLTDELRKTVGLMVGRENRMVELKETIRSLREQLVAANLEPVADDPLLGGQAPEKAQPAPGTGQPEPNEAEDHQEAPLL